ncbi:COP9 signalosome complex subunit 3 [Rhizophlyctis rosea]|uniref:COP9 signalosome complex subunit 3 n=1 Tax=Rhizophlyctis rosea TaxID=64517 RepID=A0AAD5S9U4_9FUNG|nr:COP9 signalosome complex subunit 3 [Rhizophlyctis rosea]
MYHSNPSIKLEDLLSSCAGPFSNEKQAKNAWSMLKSAPLAVLTASMRNNADPLSHLDPAGAPILYLAVLNARLRVHNPNYNVLLHAASHFVHTAAWNQLQVAPEFAFYFAQGLAELALNAPSTIPMQQSALTILEPLQYLCAYMGGSRGRFTPVHPILAKFSLLAKHPKAALPCLDIDITEIETHASHLRYQDFLLYHYYGGMIYLQLKNFERALDFFTLTIAAPATVASAIQIEAHRKYILASLLLLGKVPSLPKYTAQPVSRALKNTNTPYDDFAKAYESLNITRLQTEVSKHQDLFNKHKNWGLVTQLMDSLVRRNIQKLTQTYLTLSLSDMAKSVGIDTPQEAERHVLQMIEEGQVYATINHREGGMVYFRDAPNRFDDEETVRRFEREIAEAHVIAKRVEKLDRSLALTKEYQGKVVGGERAGAAGLGGMMAAFNDDEILIDG